jgi:hypothetical protein
MMIRKAMMNVNINNTNIINQVITSQSPVVLNHPYLQTQNGILDRKEVTAIQIMKYLCPASGIITIIPIILNSNSIENNFNNLDNYLQQNLVFIQTIIECLLHKAKTWR